MEILGSSARKGGDVNGSAEAQEGRLTLLANIGSSRQTPGAFRQPKPPRTTRPTPMKKTLFALAALMLASQVPAANWEAGKHYEVLDQPQRTNVAPGKVELMEVFSYGCPHCDRFQSTMSRLKSSLPANVQV